MKKIRIGNDITVFWKIRFAEEGYSLSDATLSLFLSVNSLEKCKITKKDITGFSIEGDILKWVFQGKDQTETGIYTLTLIGNDGSAGMWTIDACEAFELVKCDCMISNDNEDSSKVETVIAEIESTVEAVPGAKSAIIQENMKISGTVNLAKAEGKTTLQDAYNGLSVGEMAFYLVTDSNGLLPSPNQAYVTLEDSVRALFTTDSALGASVGDIVVVAKMKVLLVTVPVYRILPLNDAKAASGSFPGAMGLESPWDKKQVNLVPTALQFPTRGGDNMNDCLEPGIYPWCTLGRPAGATGAFTLSVAKSTTADNAGYYTIEQTCYGREGEAGRIFRRILFQNNSETQYNDWVEITGAGLTDGSVTTNKIAAKAVTKEKLADAVVNQLESIYYVYSLSITNLTADSSQEDIIAACGGRFSGLQDAIKASKDIVFSDAQNPDTGAIKITPTFLRPDSYKVTLGINDSMTFVFGGNVNKEITIAWDSLRSKYTCNVKEINKPDGIFIDEDKLREYAAAGGATKVELENAGLKFDLLVPTATGYVRPIISRAYNGTYYIYNIISVQITDDRFDLSFVNQDYLGDTGASWHIYQDNIDSYRIEINER